MSKKTKLKKRFVWCSGVVEILIVGWEDGRPLAYLWVGTKKELNQAATMDFSLEPKQAIALAKSILAAAKASGIKP